jgi:hypothetical protein
LADGDGADSQEAVEGSADGFPGEEGLGEFDAGLGLAEFVLGGVDFGGGERGFGLEFLFAADLELGELEAGLGGMTLGGFLIGLEADEESAFFDALTGVKVDFRDDAGHIGGDVNGVDRPDRADGFEGGSPGLRPEDQGGDRGGRGGKGFAQGDAGLDLAELRVGDAGQKAGDAGKHQEHSFPHRRALREGE